LLFPARDTLNLAALTPLLTSLTLTVVAGICARSHHQSSDDADTFNFSPVLGYLMAAIGLLFCAGPLLPGASGDMSRAAFFWYSSPFWLGAFAASVYFFRYQVVVKDQTLIAGAFRRRAIPFEDVVDWDVVRGLRSSELLVYMRSGRRLTLSGLLPDFEELVGLIDSHKALTARAQPDSPAKLADRGKRAENNAHAGWILYVGLALVALAWFVVRRLR
jgi:hypothetical protein